jgi:hypothetical protein
MNVKLAHFAGVLLVLACNKEVPKAAEEPRVASTPPDAVSTAPLATATPAMASAAAEPTPAEPSAPATPAASHVNEANFELKFSGKDAYEAGKPADATITIDAKAPFHVNDKYPYKFKLKETAGLKFANAVVGKDAAKVEKMRVTMPIGFTPEAAGKHTIAGVLSFSVCTDDKCLIEKRDLTLDVQAK